MTAVHRLLACSLLVMIAGCEVRTRPGVTVVRESRRCNYDEHWDRGRCVRDHHHHRNRRD